MESAGDRLRYVREKAGFSTVAEAARSKRFHKQNLADHEAGRRGISVENAEAYSRAFKCDPWWLLTGKGQDARLNNGRFVGVEERAGEYDQPSRADVEVFDVQIAAGDGAYIGDPHRTGTITFDRAWLRTLTDSPPNKLAVIQLDGASMEPTIPDGAWVMIDRLDKRLVANRIFAIQDGDEARIKRIGIHPQSKRVSLISDNPVWPDVENIDPAKIQVYGRVIWFSKKL